MFGYNYDTDIKIKIWNDDNKKYEKPSQHNCFFDETGNLLGMQKSLHVHYEIVVREFDPKDPNRG